MAKQFLSSEQARTLANAIAVRLDEVASAAGSDGTNAHIVQDLTEDADGTQHLYLRTWTGEDESTATTSPDLMLQVNELSAALQEIIDNYVTETSSKS